MKEVVIYTTDYCPYCIRAKQLLESEGVSFIEENIERDQEKRDELMAKSGIRTVPQVFVDDAFVGDCNGIYAMHSQGKFDEVFKG